ncbi:MAG: sigma-54 dependent transcriptional regulator [Bacteroidales bacterium]
MIIPGKLLIVDDDKGVLRSLELLLDKIVGFTETITTPNQLPEKLRVYKPDLVLLDMNFTAGKNTGNEGLFWLREIKKTDPDIIVILFTAYADIDLAVKGMREGAMDFIVKPWNNDKLINTLKTAYQLKVGQTKIRKLSKENQTLRNELSKNDFKIIGESEVMNEIIKLSDKIAGTDTNVLITGENGTGKELIARYIHYHSNRSSGPLINVDLTTISEQLFESELFGHVKGAFTDAKEDRTGRLEAAGGGTIFLDEIGNLPLAMQAKLLAVLQNRQITPVGSNNQIPIDIRLISATNKNLETQIDQGLFREDLYYRINTIRLELPPLRKRDEDAIILAEYYLDYYSTQYNKPNLKLTKNTKDEIMQYHWPGNVRELKHSLEKAVILCETDEIKPEELFFNTKKHPQEKDRWPLKFEEIEKKAILRALANQNGILSEAAKELGLTRQTLYNKLKKYHIDTK